MAVIHETFSFNESKGASDETDVGKGARSRDGASAPARNFFLFAIFFFEF